MVSEIRIYVEGGGKGPDSRAAIREGLSQFLNPLRLAARAKGLRWNVVLCGSRELAFEKFEESAKNHPDAFSLLLLDSEAPVKGECWAHLRSQDGWKIPSVWRDEQCHLMVQIIEAWLVADPERLAEYYGQHFRSQTLPRQTNVEAIDKDQLLEKLDRATRDTQKGSYHKIRHCSDLLARIRPEKVRPRAAHCERLFNTVENVIAGS